MVHSGLGGRCLELSSGAGEGPQPQVCGATYRRVIIPAPNNAAPVSEEPPVDAAGRARLRVLVEHLEDAFDWSETPEGHAFWMAVTERLAQISKTGDHRR